MTKIELKKASGPLSKYAQKARKDRVIVVKKGKPFAAVGSSNARDLARKRKARFPPKNSAAGLD
jgi:hypothetical protein